MNHAGKNRHRVAISRRGITLLEVLISMFVALVGLSGLAALFWVGGVEMSEGAKLDRAMAVARAAQRSFKILGMHRPIQTYINANGSTGLMQTWVSPTGIGPPSGSTTNAWFVDGSIPGGSSPAPSMPFSYPPSTNAPTYFTGAPAAQVAVGYYTQGFAIDPIGVIANGTNEAAFPAYDATGATINFPPNGPSTNPIPCLIRTTLMAYPQALPTGQTTPTLWTVGATGQGLTYSAGQADLVFRSQDDLLLNPPNGDYPPTQLYSSAGRRQSQGDYSWLATVVPGFNAYEVNKNNTPNTYTPTGDTNLVRVSIVVFYKRIPTVVSGDATTPPSERMIRAATATVANATATYPAPIGPDGTTATGTVPTGVSGGDVQLQSPSPSYLNLKAGQWIMLSQVPSGPQPLNPTANPATNIQVFTTYWYRWYKVVATGAVLGPVGGNYYRNVTLSGPDWNSSPSPDVNENPITTYATICDGVVAVYEKAMELEQSGGPWAPN